MKNLFTSILLGGVLLFAPAQVSAQQLARKAVPAQKEHALKAGNARQSFKGTNKALEAKKVAIERAKALEQSQAAAGIVNGLKKAPRRTALSSLPYTETFDSADDLNDWTIINNNDLTTSSGAPKTWAYYNQTYGTPVSCARVIYDYSVADDDYLISPAIPVVAGKGYEVTFTVLTPGSYGPEKLEVLGGTAATVEGLTETLLAPTEFEATSTELTVSFEATATGNYYVAFHAISEANKYWVGVDDITISVENENVPAAVTDLTVVPNEDAENYATITFTAPSTTLGGEALTSLTKIELLRDGEVVNNWNNPTVGTLKGTMNYVDAPGTYTYTVISYNEEGASKKASASAYIGVDTPLPVSNIGLQDLGNAVVLSWDAPGTEGVNGGLVKVNELTYDVYDVEIVDYGIWGQIPIDNDLVASSVSTIAAIPLNTDEGDFDFKYYGIYAKNDAGLSREAYAAAFVGTPDELPIEEHVAGGAYEYANWYYESSSSDNIFPTSASVLDNYVVGTLGQPSLGTLSSDGDGDAISLAAFEDGFIDIYLPKVSLKGATHPIFSFDYRAVDAGAKELFAAVELPDGTFDVVAESALTTSADFQTVTVDLTKYASQRWVRLYIGADFSDVETVSSLFVDNVFVIDQLENDLNVAVSGPATVNAGETAKYTVKVQNTGANAAAGYTVKVTVGDDVILEETPEEALESLACKVFEAEYEATIFAEDADLVVKAEVTFAEDLNDENNTDEIALSVKASTANQPIGVAAEATDDKGGVSVSWSTPEAEEFTLITDDFESYELGDLEFGNYTLVDGDENYVLSIFRNSPLPHEEEKYAYMVFDPIEFGITLEDANVAFTAHSGDKYLVAIYGVDDNDAYQDNDNWLISPELPGIAQTISFYARALDTSYGNETYEVLYSTTDTDVASFTSIVTGEVDDSDWVEITADLPEGAKYFAIRNTTNGDAAFVFMVDDLTYKAGGAATVESYNIYVDGELVKNTTETSVALEGVADGDHEVAVSAVYSNGAESTPVVVNVTANNPVDAINAINAAVKSFDVYTVDGVQVRKNAATTDGLKKGVYVVNGKKVVLK